MKKHNQIFAAALAVLMGAFAFAGCSNSGTPQPQPTAAPTEAPAETTLPQLETVNLDTESKSDTKEENYSIVGDGDNSKLKMDITLFDKTYTVGETKVQTLFNDGWGKDSESWEEVNLDEKIEYKKSGPYGLELDNNTTEMKISYKNLAETFAKPADCIVSSMTFSGKPEATMKKAGAKIFGKTLDLSSCTDIEKLEAALKKSVGGASVESRKYTYSSYYYYTIELNGIGKVKIDATQDNEKQTLSNLSVYFNLDYDYTYKG